MTTAAPTVLPVVTIDQNAMLPIHVKPAVATNCAEDVCIAGCDSRAECDPGDYGDFAESSKCPLNVCCSKFGFCGTTKDFCGNKKVERPVCSKKNGMKRVVGYYEGWSMNRLCNDFYPEQIPRGVYTHLNYAFASIDPDTFEILVPSQYEIDMMKRLTALKKSDPDLKVFVAVGGWTFNDPGPTATVFSDIARSQENQKAFFKSLTSFLSTYDFDGIDLDWEYPVADDRSGRAEDYKNFPVFMANLKDALKGTAGRDGLSITLPASYWYLQNFDIIKLQKHVDFFNIMSYDLHGAWDNNNKFLEPKLNAHTNLTEITNALDLLWRNKIESEKVVLGMAFYARVFSAANPSCMHPGCIFASGGNAGNCSNEVGILLNSEIHGIMQSRGLESTFDKEAAVKILHFDNNQWLSYDDADTFKLKVQFASSQCLGGVMVWAVSHDLPYGNYSLALAEAANRKVKAIALGAHSNDLETQKVHDQCKWTNCWRNCPSGWTVIARSDGGERENEGMVDHTGCNDGTDHFFCCPPDSPQPTCGWYGHHNGKCDGRDKCPDGMVEVGSNWEHCENNNYQAACCTFDTPSMKLYAQCQWAESPKCNRGTCSGSQTLVAESSTGSGGDYCLYKNYTMTLTGQETTYYERKYCCDTNDNASWEDCEEYDHYGELRAPESGVPEDYCWSNCPDSQVRVALETRNGCKGDGGRATCCTPKFTTTSKRSYNGDETRMEKLIKEFMDDPTCGIDDYDYSFDKRSLKGDGYGLGNLSFVHDDTLSTHVRRATTGAEEAIQEMLTSLLLDVKASQAFYEIWNKHVVALYEHLTIAKIEAYMTESRDWVREGSWRLVELITCNMAYYNAVVGDEDYIVCLEDYDPCPAGDWDEPLAEGEEYFDDGNYWDEDDGSNSGGGIVARSLIKRSARGFSRYIGKNGVIVKVKSGNYPPRGKWLAKGRINHPIWQSGFELQDRSNCFRSSIAVVPVSQDPKDEFDCKFIEHIPELQTFPDFLEQSSVGSLPSDDLSEDQRPAPSSDYTTLSEDFITRGLMGPILTNPGPMAGGRQSRVPIDRIMNAFGTTSNDAGFVFLDETLNTMKKLLWTSDNPIANDTMQAAIKNYDYVTALNGVRRALAVIAYLNHPHVNGIMSSSFNEVRREIGLANDAWMALGHSDEHAQRVWSYWVRNHLTTMGVYTHNWVGRWGREIDLTWGARTGTLAHQVLEASREFQNQDTTINMDDVD
ncbi:uncharacterized protein BDV14DRAFT_199024 [Aspergillus stella-maris]|uniref:uncharacterized protein n=1 Tax=Aspergillus stella-maris TaxID=1810926 RepID=UPI003CCE3448